MKSVLRSLSEPKKLEQKYPYLGVGNLSGKVVFFTGPDVGFVINLGNAITFKLGEQSSSFSEDGFTPYDGEVILSND